MQYQGWVMPAYRHLVSNLLQVNATHEVHFATVNLENIKSGPLVGVGELNLPVNSAWSEKSCVQDVYSVGRHQHLHMYTTVIAVLNETGNTSGMGTYQHVCVCVYCILH